MRHTPITRLVAALAAAALSAPALAQWTDDPTDHQRVAFGGGEQVQPKIAPTPDGGCYISWYTSDAGYDVRLQRLEADGTPAWGDNGILIADRGYSSTQDYDLDVDNDGHAVLAFRDDQFGGDRVTAQRVSPDGSLMWGANGIQFSDGVAFVGTPDIAATSDGDTVVAWASDNTTRLARIDPDGLVEWETSISEPGLTTLVASMHGAGNGTVVVSWIQYATFFGPKTLHATMVDADANEPWASRATVYGAGSLQFGNFPEFEAHEDGTSTFSWYDTQNGLNVYAQRLDAGGNAIFTTNGALASDRPGERVAPTATYDSASGITYVAWVELTNNQGSQGISTQALDASGNRLWGGSGIALTPPDANASGSVYARVLDGDLVTMWIEGGAGFGADVIEAARQDAKGDTAWSVFMASDPGVRGRLVSTVSGQQIIGAWQIGDFGAADIESHNLNPDGTLGADDACAADLTGDGVLNFFDVSAFLNAYNAGCP